MIKQFIYDMIHMTEGEKLIYYWEVWVGWGIILFLFYVVTEWFSKRKGRKR